jgi:hypothetical protein
VQLLGRAIGHNRPSGGVTLARVMPNCDLVLFANTGHWVQWEQADRFNRLIADFVGGHPLGEGQQLRGEADVDR